MAQVVLLVPQVAHNAPLEHNAQLAHLDIG